MNTQVTGPLTGIRVADFSRVLAGPHATMMLADLGADVIKIESPEGDTTRHWSPPTNTIGQSTYFASVNRGKRSVVLDFNDETDRARAFSLAASADVVIENFTPGTMAKFGLSYDEVCAANPGVVYCSITGFGDDAGAHLPGYDLLVQAVGGLMSITGQPDVEGGQATKVGVALVDILTGQNAVIGIQAALRARDASDSPIAHRGQHVKVTLLGSLLSALSNQAASTLETGVSPDRMGNAHPSISPYETFETADQPIAIAVGTDAQFTRMCTVLGTPQLAADERFATNPARVAHRAELKAVMQSALAAYPAAFWISRLTDANVPAGRVNTIAQAIELADELGLHPVAHTAAVDHAGDPHILRTPANPIWFSATPVHYVSPPPKLNEHSDAYWKDSM